MHSVWRSSLRSFTTRKKPWPWSIRFRPCRRCARPRTNQPPPVLVQRAMTSMLQAWRALARRPLFTIATLLTMTAGIGVTTAVFSIVDRVLIRPLPFPDGNQLVSVYEASPSRREAISLLAPARLADWNRLNQTFEAISGNYSESVTDTSGAE